MPDTENDMWYTLCAQLYTLQRCIKCFPGRQYAVCNVYHATESHRKYALVGRNSKWNNNNNNNIPKYIGPFYINDLGDLHSGTGSIRHPSASVLMFVRVFDFAHMWERNLGLLISAAASCKKA